MARERRFDVSGINIRVHTEHKAEEYVELWKMLHRSKRYISRASNALMIGDVRYDELESSGTLSGNFYRFLEVDLEDPWFDIERHKKASDEDVETVNIPPQLKPNLVEIPYVFDVRSHRLFFVAHEAVADLSPRTVHKLLTALCSMEEITDRFGKVDLTVLSERNKIDEMLRWPVLRSVTIRVERPNPTDEEDEAEFYEGLRRRGAESETRVYKKASDSASIYPDEEMKALAHIAANNGLVEVAGTNPQRWSDRASSRDFPLKLKGAYDSNLQTLMDALKGLVRLM